METNENKVIVSRIWKQLGSPTYAELKGRNIYDLIEELKAHRITSIFCKNCNSIQPSRTIFVEASPENSIPWGDVCCNTCHSIAATFVRHETAPTAHPQPATQPATESRSQLRRIAAQKGEPAPDFSRPATDKAELEDAIELAFWRHDAKHKGYADWKFCPMSERDSFKSEVRAVIAADRALRKPDWWN